MLLQDIIIPYQFVNFFGGFGVFVLAVFAWLLNYYIFFYKGVAHFKKTVFVATGLFTVVQVTYGFILAFYVAPLTDLHTHGLGWEAHGPEYIYGFMFLCIPTMMAFVVIRKCMKITKKILFTTRT